MSKANINPITSDTGSKTEIGRAPPSLLPCIESIEDVASTKWLALKTISYTDQEGGKRKWDVATRTTKKQKSDNDDNCCMADAVVIIPLLKKKKEGKHNHAVETLLVEQYRPPVGRVTIEFPAGLIDKNETPEEAALRELHEETGFFGEKQCKVISREVCMSPGLTDETVVVVVVDVDLDDPRNHGIPPPNPDAGEFVTVKRVNIKQGLQQVLDDGHGMPIEGLYLFALGFDLGASINGGSENCGI